MVNLDSHYEQSLLVLFKEALQQYRCYLRKITLWWQVYKRISGEVSCAKFRRHWMEKPWYALVSFPGWGTVYEITWQFELLLSCMCFTDLFLQEICSKKNSGLKRTTRYHKYAARCFALVSTCCPVSLYLHTYLVHYVTAVCMIACLSIVCSKLSDLYEWLH